MCSTGELKGRKYWCVKGMNILVLWWGSFLRVRTCAISIHGTHERMFIAAPAFTLRWRHFGVIEEIMW